MADSSTDDDPTNCKVGRLIDEYDLHGLGDEMARDWRGDDGDRASLRTLADRFNRALLERALETAERRPLDRELETWYRLLTDAETSQGDRIQARRQLERFGVDVDRLRDDFVSYQAVRTYLTNYRGVSYDDPAVDPTAVVNSIQKLQTRLERVAASKAERLVNAGIVDAGDLRASVDVHLVCEKCDARFLVAEFVDCSGCECEDV